MNLTYLLVISIVIIVTSSTRKFPSFFEEMSSRMVGGVGDVKPATSEIQQLIDGVRSEAEKQAGQKFTEFKAISFKSQVVAGTNYFVKVDVGSGNYVHLRVFEPLPYTRLSPELTGMQMNKTAADPIVYF